MWSQGTCMFALHKFCGKVGISMLKLAFWTGYVEWDISSSVVSCSFLKHLLMIFLLQAKRGSVLRCNSWCLHPYSLCSKLVKFSCPLFVVIFFFCKSCFFPMWQMKYPERVLGLILVSPLCKAPSWTEWLYNKVLISMTKLALLVNVKIMWQQS